jgi:N-acylneuraminate cytidylyltransferase
VPLIGHTIEFAHSVGGITRTIVSTDDPDIAATSERLGADIPFLRPAELATDDAAMAPVVRHALEFVEDEEGTPYDAVLLLDPTSPIRDSSTISAAISTLAERADVDGIVSVSEPTFHPLWVGVEAGADGLLTRFFDEAAGVTRRQDNHRRYLRINGNFYLWTADFVRRLSASWFDEGTFAAFELPEACAFSIDDEYEFRLIEALASAGVVSLPGGTRHDPV